MSKNMIARQAIRLGIVSAIAIATTVGAIGTTTKPAQASLKDGADFLDSKWSDIVQYAWTPWTLQVFMTDLSPQETQAVQNQFRKRADGELHSRCVYKVADMYWRGLRNTALKTTHRWLVATRVENGRANCYQRLTRRNVEEFVRRRGW